ncbi:G-protein coupled receptor moody-like [Centruroides sculpturatus]|uniref:G-protein coupled receptor moody-like n=1 Tax=Centruroides sculpturatus TaxID=218467 RepID=UPI000C6E53A8|nr:G-protein coupled receptor moody-like [Centruroides sculpturatus]
MNYSQDSSSNNYNLSNSTIVINLFDKYPPELLYFAAACCSCFVVIGVPGNIITIIALLKSPRLRNATSAFIINLCAADGFYCAFTLPLATSTFIHMTWIYDNYLCMIYPLIRYSNATVSVLTIMAITINRYVIIVHPKIYSRIYTKISISISIVCIWLVSFLLLVPTALGIWGKFAFNPQVGTCTMVNVNGKSSKNFLFFMAFCAPTLVFAFCYSRIYWVVRKSEKSLQARRKIIKEEERSICSKLNCCRTEKKTSKIQENRKTSKDLKLLKVILVIFLAFIFCYVPLIIVKIFRKEESLPILNIIGYIGYFFTGCVNPIIYVIMSSEYRKAYKELFICSEKTRRNRAAHMSHL